MKLIKEEDLEKISKEMKKCAKDGKNIVSEDVLYDIIKHTYICDVVDELIEEAKMNGGLDNIAVIVIDPFDVEVNRC